MKNCFFCKVCINELAPAALIFQETVADVLGCYIFWIDVTYKVLNVYIINGVARRGGGGTKPIKMPPMIKI